MPRGRSGSVLPIFLLVVLGLIFVIGTIIFGASMQSVYVETNYTAQNLTVVPYELQSAWWLGAAVLVMILALAFALWHFWG